MRFVTILVITSNLALAVLQRLRLIILTSLLGSYKILCAKVAIL